MCPNSSRRESNTQKPYREPANSTEGTPLGSICFGVFLNSMAILLLEISLTRIFSYTIWYHFTYLTISLAMLGFGASGAVLAASKKLASMSTRLAQSSSLLAAVSVPLMLLVVSKVPFYPFQIFQEPVQLLYLVLYYIAVTLPFFCGGITISCIFKIKPAEASRIYFWDLIGAGTACLIVVYAIDFLGVPGVAAFSAVLFILGAAFLARSTRVTYAALAAAAMVSLLFSFHIENLLKFSASKEKWITRMAPEKIDFTKWSPIFRIDSYKVRMGENAGPIYGIKNKYVPAGLGFGAIAHDGDACAMMLESDDKLSTYQMFEKSILKFPYLLLDRPSVLVIGPGGGVDVGMALESKAKSVVAVELDPITVDLVKHRYADFVGHLYDQPGVKVIVDEGRSFLRRSKEKLDLIQMTGVDTLAALNSGAYVLAENYLYTVEAYNDFMNHLNPDGILSLAFMDNHYGVQFPRHTARYISLSIEALRRRGIKDPQNQIAVMAGIPYVLVLTKMTPFTLVEVRKLRDFSKEYGFQIWYLPGGTFQNPAASLITFSPEERKEYYREQPLEIAATTDDSPFFFHFYKWATLLKEHRVDTRHSLATGQLILLLVLLLSILFSILLIIFPLYKFQNAGLQTERKWRYILYFAALGFGFIFLEISYIQRFILFLGYPTYSLTVILFSLLTFSGLGSYLSGRLPLSPERLIGLALVGLSVVALGYMVLLPPIFNYFLGSLKEIRILLSVLLLLPLGLFLGVFFPSGIRIISLENSRFVPWAWGINGCASVIGTVLSIIIAISFGFSTVTVLAVIIYVIGVSAFLLARRPENVSEYRTAIPSMEGIEAK